MKIGIILLNYNSFIDCKKCITYLKRQKNINYEIIVVDNCSSSKEHLLISNLCKNENCTFISSIANKGYNAGNNIGIKYAIGEKYEYSLIINPDVELRQADYLHKLVSVIEKDNDVVAIGSDILNLDGIHQNPMCRDGNWKTCFNWISQLFPYQKVNSNIWRNSGYCYKLSGCCFLIRNSFLEKIKLFDEGVFLYCEEAILSKQVEKHHLKMFYYSESQAIHAHKINTKGNPINRINNWKKSRLYFIEKYSTDSYIGKIIQKISVYVRTFVLYIHFKTKK